MIPRASYQTVSRLQQLLSAQNTQALPFQLKGSLTKSGEEKKIPCQRRAGLPAAQGALRRALRHPSPPADPGPVRPAWRGGDGCQPQPADPWGWQRVLLQPRGPSLLFGCFLGCRGSGAQGLGLGRSVPQVPRGHPRRAAPAGQALQLCWFKEAMGILPGKIPGKYPSISPLLPSPLRPPSPLLSDELPLPLSGPLPSEGFFCLWSLPAGN